MPVSVIPKGLQPKAEALLASIVPHYTVLPDGSLRSSAMGMKLYEDALLQLLDVGPSRLTPAEFEPCARRALIATIRGQIPSFKAFSEHLDNEIITFKRKPKSPFRVCSRCYFSVPPEYELELDLWSAKLLISQRVPEGLSSDQPELRDGRTAFADPAFGAYLTMTVFARTKVGALDDAARDIGFL